MFAIGGIGEVQLGANAQQNDGETYEADTGTGSVHVIRFHNTPPSLGKHQARPALILARGASSGNAAWRCRPAEPMTVRRRNRFPSPASARTCRPTFPPE